ncbi:DUF433 domain-containing protein [Microcoleus vaginatus]
MPKTRITVKNIAIDFNAGLPPEKIFDEKPHLTRSQIYGVVA